LKVGLGSAEGRIQLDRDAQAGEGASERGADDAPIELAVATTQRRNSQRLDAPAFVVRQQVFEAGDDVL